ncbi:MAG: type II toxin-antitoxin system RelE/ParE family toxin [Marinicella sp.]
MSHNIKLKPKAYDDLTNIYQYSLKEFGQAKATEYIRLLDKTFHKLANDCNLGTDYSEIRPELLAYLAISHIVFFKRSKQDITVLRILHQSMDFKLHL